MNQIQQKKKKGCLHYILIAIAVFFGIGIIGTAMEDDGQTVPTTTYEAAENHPEAAHTANLPNAKPAEPKKTVYKAGHYKVGADIPAGVYYLIEDGIMPYFNVTTDANGDDILFYSVFSGNHIAEVRDGEYFKLTSCYAVPYEDAPAVKPENGWLKDGFYVVGRDIPAGEYKLEAPENATLPCYSIYADLRQDDLVSFGVLESTQYVEVKEGQYLDLTNCKIYIGE
jgi:hypothetical protein